MPKVREAIRVIERDGWWFKLMKQSYVGGI